MVTCYNIPSVAPKINERIFRRMEMPMEPMRE